MGKRGPMPGTGGGPKKALADRLANGNTSGRPILVMPAPKTLDSVEVPAPDTYIDTLQKDGSTLYARELYENTWKWLVECKCDHLFTPANIEQYAMSISRWIQCEEAISQHGFLAKHPTTGQAITSPYVGMSLSYMKQVSQQWAIIYSIVRANCSVEFADKTPQDDAMEYLLRARERRL